MIDEWNMETRNFHYILFRQFNCVKVGEFEKRRGQKSYKIPSRVSNFSRTPSHLLNKEIKSVKFT
jgi:hypothetical protein